MSSDRRLQILRDGQPIYGVPEEMLAEIDAVDPLRLALRREIAVVNAAVEYVHTNTANMDDIKANDEAWDQLQLAVGALTQAEADFEEAVTPDEQ